VDDYALSLSAALLLQLIHNKKVSVSHFSILLLEIQEHSSPEASWIYRNT